jgi:hypothetical protein
MVFFEIQVSNRKGRLSRMMNKLKFFKDPASLKAVLSICVERLKKIMKTLRIADNSVECRTGTSIKRYS